MREEQVAFVPGSAAYVDGRGGSSMRLNFSGADADGIVEGIRRIGKVVDEQIALYGTFTGSQPARAAERRAARDAGAGAEQLADVVQLPRRRAASAARGGS